MLAKIVFPFRVMDDKHRELEDEICHLLFDDDTPLLRIAKSIISFDEFPFPSYDPKSGRLELFGSFPEDFVNIMQFHPRACVSRGMVRVNLSRLDLRSALEDAFMAYLAHSRRPRVRNRLIRKENLMRRSNFNMEFPTKNRQ